MGEKTEDPTPKRLSEARSEGRVAKSADLTAAVLLSIAVLLLTLYSKTLFFTTQAILREALSSSLASDSTVEGVLDFAAFAFIRAGALVAPALLIVAAAALVVQYLQVGWLLTLKPLKPKISQLNVVNGLQKLFNKRNAVKLVVNLAKLAVVGTLAWVVASDAWPRVVALPTLHTKAALVEAVRILLQLAIWLLVAMLVIGVIDFIYQKWQHRQDLKMTKQEVKDERKASEGDTETKRRRLSMA
ncbi:MAG: EscU/YscU/HrcU family type III secretion system export apparatus switch protein, partial [Planctomycetota bacterium]